MGNFNLRMTLPLAVTISCIVCTFDVQFDDDILSRREHIDFDLILIIFNKNNIKIWPPVYL